MERNNGRFKETLESIEDILSVASLRAMKLSSARKEFVNVKFQDIIFNGEAWIGVGC